MADTSKTFAQHIRENGEMESAVDTASKRAAQKRALDVCELFRDLPANALETLAAQCDLRDFAAGTLVIGPGQKPPHRVYVVVEGIARVFQEAKLDYCMPLAELGPGSYFGEFAAIEGSPGSAFVAAKTDATLAEIPREAFLAALRDYPAVTFRLMERMVQLIRRLDDRVVELESHHNEFQRIHRELRLVTL